MASSECAQQQSSTLVDSAVAKAIVVSKRKICEFCQKTYHRNSLKRHQKICAGNLSVEEQNKVCCFKENAQKKQEKAKAEDGRHGSSYPPKLQVANIADVNSVSDISPRQGPPKLQSINDDNSAGFRRSLSSDDESVPVTKKLRSYSSFSYKGGNSQKSHSPRKLQSTQATLKGIQKDLEDSEQISTETVSINTRGVGERTVNNVTDNANFRSRSNGTQKCKYENLRTSSRLGESFTKPKSPCASSSSASTSSSSSLLPSSVSQKRLSITKKTKKSLKKVKSDPVIVPESVATKCLSCNDKFDVQSELVSHGLIHLKEGNLVCLQCSNKKIEDLDSHYKSDHQSERKKENCELCSKTVDKNNSLYHYKEHHTLTKYLKCNLCDQAFSFMQNLLYHKSNEHLREALYSKFCPRNGDMMKIKNGHEENDDSVKNNKKDSGSDRVGVGAGVGVGLGSGPPSLTAVSTNGQRPGNDTDSINKKYSRYGASKQITTKAYPKKSEGAVFSNECVFEDAVDSQTCKMDGARMFSQSPVTISKSDKHLNGGFTDLCGIFISTTSPHLSDSPDSDSQSSIEKNYYDAMAGLFVEVNIAKRLTRNSVESAESSSSSYSSISSTSGKTEIDYSSSMDVSPPKNILTEEDTAAKDIKTVRNCIDVVTKSESGDDTINTDSMDQDNDNVNDEASNDSAINSMKSESSKSDFLISSNKKYSCRLCKDDRFDSTFEYLNHLKIEHHWTAENLLNPEYEPEYWCPECGLEFIVRPTLVKHLIIAHEEIKDIDEYMECLGYGVRPLMKFQCSVCYSVFQSDLDLCSHRRCHGLAYLQFLTSSSSGK